MEYKIINCPHCGKIIPGYAFKGKSKRAAVTCPECGSQKNYKDGNRRNAQGRIIQRYLCRKCGLRFS